MQREIYRREKMASDSSTRRGKRPGPGHAPAQRTCSISPEMVLIKSYLVRIS